MTAQNGALVLIKIGDGAMTESFTTIGGLRTSSMVLNNQMLESTNVSTGQWKQLLNNSGIQSVSLSGSGLFTDSVAEDMMRQNALSSIIGNYRFYFANGDYMTGPFKVASYERSGNHNSEEIYSLILESAGTITFTAI